MEPLPAMATFAQRVEHAIKTRGLKPIDLDRALAERFAKKGVGAGYTHRLLHMSQEPHRPALEAIAEILSVSLAWLVAGKGSMDPGSDEAPTYDSLAGWAAAAAAEMERGRTFGYAIRAAGRAPAFVRPEAVTPDFVFEAATFWLRHAPESEQQAAMKAEAQRLKGAEDTKRRRH